MQTTGARLSSPFHLDLETVLAESETAFLGDLESIGKIYADTVLNPLVWQISN